MERLIRGAGEFMQSVTATERAFFQKLAGGQAPEALFLTCSDSRVDTSMMTQTKPGDIFVMRNAGNIVPPPDAGMGGEAASIEYAIEVLKVKDIVLCGHTDCGAMRAVLDPRSAEGLSVVPTFLEHAAPARVLVEEMFEGEPDAVRLLAATELNVLVQIEHIRLFPFVKRACDEGRLHVHAWVFDIGRSEIRAFDNELGKFARLDGSIAPLAGSPIGTPEDWPI